MMQLLQPKFERGIPCEIERLTHEPRAQIIGRPARHADRLRGDGDRRGLNQRFKERDHPLARPAVVAGIVWGGDLRRIEGGRDHRSRGGAFGWLCHLVVITKWVCVGKGDLRLGKACGVSKI